MTSQLGRPLWGGTSWATPPTPGPHCELPGSGPLLEPIAAYTSAAFVLAALAIVALAARARGLDRTRVVFAVLVAGIGVGSFIQHGPNPAYADLLHDLPLLGTLAFVAADSLAALVRRERVWWWWAAPTVAAVPLILAAPLAGDGAQVVVAAAAVVLTLARARRERPVRRRVGWAVGLLAVGSIIGTLSRGGWPLCDPESLWQGHAVWHVLAAAALVVLAPTLTSGEASTDEDDGR